MVLSGPFLFVEEGEENVEENVMETFLTVTDASKRVGLSAYHLRELANGGKVKCIRASDGTRLFSPKELDRFVEHQVKRAKARAV